MKLVAYMRVSKQIGMDVENQRPPIERWLKVNEIDPETVVFITEEESTRKVRPKMLQTYEDLKNGVYDGLIVYRLDRWGRNMLECVASIDDIVKHRNRRFISVADSMDLTKESFNATAQMMLQMISVIAQYERELIRERTLLGLETAKKSGTKLGRPHGAKDKGRRRRSGYWARWMKEKQGKSGKPSPTNGNSSPPPSPPS